MKFHKGWVYVMQDLLAFDSEKYIMVYLNILFFLYPLDLDRLIKTIVMWKFKLSYVLIVYEFYILCSS